MFWYNRDMPVLDKNLLLEMSPDIRDHFPFAEIRPSQEAILKTIEQAHREDKKFIIVEAPTGGGKCFAPNTPILMYDGTIKNVENVRIGDLLMGPDSRPRRVVSLSHGFDEMYDVTPVKGDKYIVNSQHILSLKFTKGFKVKGTYANNQKSQVPYYRKHNIKIGPEVDIDIPLLDYLSLSKNQKHILKGYRTGVGFPPQAVAVNPYFLGLWLGDGSQDAPEVASAEPEIAAFLFSYAEQLGLQITPYFHNNCGAYYLSTGSPNNKNPLLDALRGLGVINNKHIPQVYKSNSRESRLQLLAGLIDSDGHHIVHGGYDFVFKARQLAEDVAYLCRSLGFASYTKPCKKTCTNAKGGPVVGD